MTKKTEQIDPWADARAACRTHEHHKRLMRAQADGWTPLELTEYVRSCFHRPGGDEATSYGYQQALWFLEGDDAKLWLKEFRARGGKPLPPRPPEELSWSPGLFGIDSECLYWPFHPTGFVEMIAQRARDHFGMPEGSPVHPNAWGAACRAYWRDRHKARREARREAKRQGHVVAAELQEHTRPTAEVPT